MLRRIGRLAALVVIPVLLGAGMCGGMAEANEVDRERIETMRADPIFVHRVDEVVHEGDRVKDFHNHNGYTGYLDPWRGGPEPDEPTAQLVREQAIGVLDELRANGWIIVGARCQVQARARYSESSVRVTYVWSASGYRFHDGVPYGAGIDTRFRGDFADDEAEQDPPLNPQVELRVSMSAPFHADPDTDRYFRPAPDPLAPGETCLERGEPPEPDDDRRRDDTITDGVAPGRLWDLPRT